MSHQTQALLGVFIFLVLAVFFWMAERWRDVKADVTSLNDDITRSHGS